MVDAYQELTTHDGSDWVGLVERLNLSEVFMPLIDMDKDPTNHGAMIRYIVWAYSKKSDRIVLGMDWKKNKEKIFEETMMYHSYRDMFIDVSYNTVSDAIQLWIDYQDDDLTTQIFTLKDLKQQMQKSCVSDIKKANDEVDYDQKFKNAKYVIDLNEMIKNLELELVQNDPKLKKGSSEVRAITKNKNTFGVEKFSK